MHGADLNTTLADVNDNDSLPTAALHWAGGIDVDSVNTWDRNFIHFRTVGQSQMVSPNDDYPRVDVPATARC